MVGDRFTKRKESIVVLLVDDVPREPNAQLHNVMGPINKKPYSFTPKRS